MSGGKGNSRANTASTANTSQTTTNNIDNRVYTSDFGAIQEGADVAREALRTGENVFLDLGNLAESLGIEAIRGSGEQLNRGLDFAQNAYETSLGFGRDVTSDAVNAVADTANRSIDTLSASQSESLGFISDLVNGLFGFAGDTIDKVGAQAETLAGQSIEGNQSLARATSESADDKVTRLGGYALAAIAAIFVVPAIFGKAQ